MDKAPHMAGPNCLPLSLPYQPNVGPTWAIIGARAPMHVGHAWGGVPHAPNGLGSLPRSGMGPGGIRVSQVEYLLVRLACSPILNSFAHVIVNSLCAPYRN